MTFIDKTDAWVRHLLHVETGHLSEDEFADLAAKAIYLKPLIYPMSIDPN
jgi:hypothetical protein